MSNYIKPNISFQRLNIAAVSTGCALQSNNAESVCPVEVPGQPGLTIFSELGVCVSTLPGAQDSICYHVPTADTNVFES